jgi:carboxylesterase
VFPALAVVAAIAVGLATYPRFLERRQARRRALGPDGFIVGAAPIDLPKDQGPAVLMLHGGGDTTQTLQDLAIYLHRRGFAVRAPVLSGHGQQLAALSQASARRWHDQVREEFDALRAKHHWISVVGLSMGGSLAVKLAAERRMNSLVLLAPYVDMPAMVRAMAKTTGAWGWLFPYFSSRGSRSIRDPGAASRTLGHGLLTPAALRALYDVVNDATEALPAVRVPTLVVQSREDNRIPPDSAERAFARLGSAEKKFVWTDGAGHVITVDFGHQRVFGLTADWLEAHVSKSS